MTINTHSNIIDSNITIRHATLSDLAAITAIETACFPAAEAATSAQFADRLTHYADHFRLLLLDDRIISFVNGMATDTPDLSDDMYANAALHNPNGKWQMIFGVNTLPEFRRRGYAANLLRKIIADTKDSDRSGLVLTCKDALVHYYAAFGFTDEGISSKSTHGGVVWHQMRLKF